MSGPSSPNPQDPRFVPPIIAESMMVLTEKVERGEDLFPDLELPAEEGEREPPLHLSMPPPKRLHAPRPEKPDSEILQEFLRSFGPELAHDPEAKQAAKNLALYYEKIVAAGMVSPISKSEQLVQQVNDVETATAYAAETATAALNVDAALKTDESLAMVSYLAAIFKNMNAFRAALMEMMGEDGRITLNLTKVSRENTLVEIDAYHKKTLEAREEARREADRVKKVKGIVGWLLAAVAAVGFFVTIVTFGAGSPLAAVTVASLSIGLGVTGGNLIAESYGKPSLNTLIAKSMENIKDPKDRAILAGLLFSISAAIAILSFGAMSGAAAGFFANTTTLMVTAGVAGTIGSTAMSVMTEAFLQSAVESIKRDLIKSGVDEKEAEERANQIAQAIMWTFTALVLISSVGGQLLKGGLSAGLKMKQFVLNLMARPGALPAVTPTMTAAANAANALVEAGGTLITQSAEAAVPTTLRSTITLESALRSILKGIQDLWNEMGSFHGVFKLTEIAAKFGEAAVSFALYRSLMQQASAVISQAEYEEVLTICRALQKLIDTTIQALLTNQSAAANQAADMGSFFVEVISILSQTITAATTYSYAGLSSVVSSAVTPKKKEEEEQEDPNLVAAIAQAVPSCTSSVATASGVAGRILATTPELKQRLALTYLMSILSKKLSEIFTSLGWEKQFGERMAREVAPLMLKAFLQRGSSISETSPSLTFLTDLMGSDKEFAFSGTGEPLEIAPFMEVDADLLAFMGQLKELQGLQRATPQQLAVVLSTLMKSLFKLRKKGEEDQINELSLFIEALLGESGMDPLAFSLDLSSGEEIGSVLHRFVTEEESGDRYRLLSPA